MAKSVRRRRKKSRLTEAEKLQKEASLRIAEREEELRIREEQRVREEQANEELIDSRLRTLRVNHEAQKRLNSEVTRQRPFALPEEGWTAEDFVKEDDSDLIAIIEGLHYRGNNTLLVAEFKTGKTTLETNLAGALVDGRPFLGKFETFLPYGNIAFFNYEMDARQFRIWLRDSGIENKDRIIPLNLRGWQLPFWGEEELLRLAEWLLTNDIEFIIIDPAARAWRGLVEHEGDNVQLAEFFGALDELKRLGDCPNLLISTHKPRAAEDRARGGGEVEAWPDGNWYLNREKGNDLRTLRAEGRDIELPSLDLEWEPETRTMRAAGSTEERWEKIGVERVVAALSSHGEVEGTQNLCDLMKGKTGDKRKWIAIAVEKGFVTEQRDGQKKVYNLA